MTYRVLLQWDWETHRNYVASLQAAGTSVTTDPAEAGNCRGLLLPGGGDIHGTLDDGERSLIQSFLETGRPILGICRGMQALNVFFGGTLYRCIPGHQILQGDLLHPVRSSNLLAQLMGKTAVVNSNHHQAVERLGWELEAAQWAQDGVIEGLVHRRLPVWGTQWHPERQSFGLHQEDRADAAPIFTYFLAQMRESI